MTVLFGFRDPLHSSQKSKMASGKQEAQLDDLVHFEAFIREEFLNGKHVLSIFLTLKKHMTPLGSTEL